MIRKLQNNKGFMRYFKNTSWLFFEKILRLFVNIFVGIWVARYLGPENFGLFSYAISFVGLFIAISTLGLDSIVVRNLVNNSTKKNEILTTAFLLRCIGSILVFLALIVAVNFTSNDKDTNILIFIIAGTTIFQSFNVIDFYFQSQVMSKYSVFANIISLSISSVIKIILILNDAPLVAFAYVLLFDSFILSCGLVYFYFKQTSVVKYYKFSKKIAKSLLRDSWPLILSGMVIAIYMKIDQIMIKEILGNEFVGQYAAAVKLSEAWYFIPMVIATSLFPAIVNAKKISNELYYTRLQKIYDLMVWMAIAIAIPMTFLSDWLVNILYGVEYNQSGTVLTIHIWTGVFVFLGVAFGKYLSAENLTKKAFYRTLLGAVLNISLNYVLIPKYGINGAAVATLLGQFSANYLYDVFDKDLHGQLKMKTMSFFPIHILRGYNKK
ncbi:MAG: Membrane protein involved in the export of O-antigen, teichoic acid lipoteichoic acids [uncultured Campylobacterales bacterium]|uniref:Membrane protein involved in the export of O-antigen, teichoic acid lipoteichoic acids n=1 Tax=uncultured Campylobacterales bacterium TaxID=352960 RepID=A0A6S6TG11_9BACT|nr:MAG: Membrane protein involved in the export of O-antigen, teichoic acid lipoteichoic acids [uncultured Campylobacterales bacterium]